MGRLLLHGRRDSLLRAVLAGVFPGRAVVKVPADDPLGTLAGEPADLLVVDPACRPAQAPVLVRAARDRFPDLPIVIVHGPAHRAAATRLVMAGADLRVEEPFALDELRVVLLRAVKRALRPPAATRAAPVELADLDALAQLVQGLAHEVNNPLTTIRGFLQLLLHDDDPERPATDRMAAYRTMEAESHRIADVIEELEYFSGTRRPTRTVVDLRELVRNALQEAGLGGLTPRGADREHPVLADRGQLTHALHYLFAPFAGVVEPATEVLLERTAEQVRVRVAGSAPALAATPPDRLLVPLYGARAPSGARRVGLARVYGIARAHGGDVQVSLLGGGRLAVRFSLPAALPD